MGKIPIHQIRGLKNFIQDAVEGGVNATAQTHHAIARKPYEVLKKISPLAAPAGVIEQVQAGITNAVYQSILTIVRLNAAIANQAIDLLESQAKAGSRANTGTRKSD